MAKRKVTEKDVKEAYKMAEDARQRALYSMRRARQMKDAYKEELQRRGFVI